MKKILVGSRESRLAVIQSQMVMDAVKAAHPDIEMELITMKTTGDIILDRTLDQIGGKGLFVKELDAALMDGRADITVHSSKDLPMEIPEQLPLAAFSKRADPRDVLVLPAGKTEIDFTKPIGCSSLRRQLQLKKLYPQATLAPIRGNVITRLQKLDRGDFGALVLAGAGLVRLGLEDRISRYFSVEEILPAAGQAILAVQSRKDLDTSFLKEFNDADAEDCLLAERAFVRTLDGGCSSPVAAYAQVEGETLHLKGMYVNEDNQIFFDRVSGSRQDCQELGRDLAYAMKRKYCRNIGQVTLVGAGPGDPGLLTLAGKEALFRAEVVVYDRLVGPQILAMMPENAEKINVGKRSSHHIVPQDQINEILLQKALEGKNVVRLKGGDPFLFGRGGEELELLCRYDVPFREIPGITSAISVPAYAGIPVTHRDFCSSVHIVTGHQRAGVPLNIPFKALMETRATLVFLMGVTALPQICQGLLQAGMDPMMPAAVVEKGTTPNQRPILATVATLPETAEKARVQSPAIIIVGKVCTLSPSFDWFDRLRLKGQKILVTRPKDRAGTLSHKLRDLGADVTEMPCIETLPLEDCPQMDQALREIDSYQWLAFTSPAGVSTLMETLRRKNLDVRALGRIRLAAIGPGTDRELRKHGLHADLMPEVYDGNHLGLTLAAEKPAGKVLILRAQWGTDDLTNRLKEAGISYNDVRCYETRYVCQDPETVRSLLNPENPPIVTFTSASTVKGFVGALGDFPRDGLLGACIGQQTQAEAQKHGIATIVAEKATMDSLIDAICSYVLK